MSEKEKKGIWNYYEVDQKKRELKPNKKRCPRCGSFMGFYEEGKQRYCCGKCHYTEFV